MPTIGHFFSLQNVLCCMRKLIWHTFGVKKDFSNWISSFFSLHQLFNSFRNKKSRTIENGITNFFSRTILTCVLLVADRLTAYRHSSPISNAYKKSKYITYVISFYYPKMDADNSIFTRHKKIVRTCFDANAY